MKISEEESKVPLIPDDKIEDVQKLAKLKDIQEITRDLATEMIDENMLFEDKEIQIQWKFQDVFEMLMRCKSEADCSEEIA